MVRNIDGQGRLITKYPPSLASTDLPSRVIMSASIPGNGFVPDPGLVVVAPGMGVIMIEPVSVCHHVSTIGLGKVRRTFVHDGSRTIRERTVNDVTMTGDPTDVGRTPVDVIVFEIKN